MYNSALQYWLGSNEECLPKLSLGRWFLVFMGCVQLHFKGRFPHPMCNSDFCLFIYELRISMLACWVWWCMSIITATPEAQIGRVEVWDHARQKISKLPSQQINWMWWNASVIPGRREAQVGGSWFKSSHGQTRVSLSEKWPNQKKVRLSFLPEP
jgi:hypothetical protein